MTVLQMNRFPVSDAMTELGRAIRLHQYLF